MEMFSRNTVAADDPRLATVHANFAGNLREMVYETKGDRAQMIVFLRDRAASGPTNALLYSDLARLLVETSETDEAVVALQTVESRANAEGDAGALTTIHQMQPQLVLAGP